MSFRVKIEIHFNITQFKNYFILYNIELCNFEFRNMFLPSKNMFL